MLRLIVIKGNDPENKVIKNIEKERKTIEADIKKSFNKPFACKPDAQKAIDDFLKKHHWSSVKEKVSILLSILYNLTILNSHNGTSVIRYS